jgi:glycosyltransferase involved in cell wall biosynthesis
VTDHTGADPTPSISVVVCAYTEARWADLLEALDSVRDQRLPALETILVIDHNPALYARALGEITGTVTIENVQQRGLSGARNSGVAVARGEVVAFMDDDAVARADWLERLAGAYVDRSVVGAGGSIVPLWEERRPGWFPEEFDWVVGCTYRGMPTVTASVRNMIGCNMSFRRDVFEGVGGFSHGIGRLGTRPLGGEETELSIRALQRWPDKRIVFEPSAAVDHRVPRTRATVGYFGSRCYSEGLSKAVISKLVGAGDGLSTERGYAVRTLGGAVLRNLGAALHRREPVALGRAAMIVAGLGITTAGYAMGTLSGRALAPVPVDER